MLFLKSLEAEVTMPPCRIELFGGLRVYFNGRLITRFRTRKTASLLAYLAYHLDRIHSRELLVEMFWGNSNSERGRNSLSKAVSSLRKQLSFQGGDKDSVIIADRFYVGLKSELVSTDIADFETHLKMANSARLTSERIFHLSEAVKFYRGELLPEFYDDWVERERLRRSGQFELAIQELVNLHEQMGDIKRALNYARLATTIEPFSEIALEQVLRLLLAINQPAEAIREFKFFLQRLKERFGSEAFVESTRLRLFVNQAEQRLNQLQRHKENPVVSQKGSWIRTNFSRHFGTVTLLAVFWRACDRGQHFTKTLEDLVEHYNGQIVRVKGNTLFSIFPSASRALECAFACREQLQKCSARCFLDTVDLISKGDLFLALKRANRLISRFVKDDQVVCLETTATLLKQNSSFLLNLRKAKFLGVPKSLRLFTVNIFGLAKKRKNQSACFNLKFFSVAQKNQNSRTDEFGRSELSQLHRLT